MVGQGTRQPGIRTTSSLIPSSPFTKRSGLIILGPNDLTRFFNQLQFLIEKHSLYDTVIIQYYNQLYRFTDGILFNEIIQNPTKHSTAERGFYLKIITSELETWSSSHLGKHFQGAKLSGTDVSTACTLPYTTQSCNVLVLDKLIFTDVNLVKQLVPILSMPQLLRLLSKFQPSSIAPQPVPKNVLKHVESMAGNIDNPTGITLVTTLMSYPLKMTRSNQISL